jgi:hypothetical protein
MMTVARVSGAMRAFLGGGWTPILLAIVLMLDATTLPRFSFPGRLARVFSSVRSCYFPAQVWMKDVNGKLELVGSGGDWDVTATFDPRLWQSGFWAPMTTVYRTTVADWRRDGAPVTPTQHTQVVGLVTAWLEQQRPGSNSAYLELLKKNGEGLFEVARPWGIAHNTGSLLVFALLVVSCKMNLARLSSSARRRRARDRRECFRCGYSLVGCPEGVCPECGAEQAG